MQYHVMATSVPVYRHAVFTSMIMTIEHCSTGLL